MSFLKKIFGRTDPLDDMRQCHARQDWAAVLRIAGQIDDKILDSEIQAEISAWVDEAGDALAAINLDEGAWAQKSGNLLRAREDYQLAMQQARSATLQQRAKEALAALEQVGTFPAEVATHAAPAGGAACNSSCTGTADPASPVTDTELDDETRVELLLATMPTDLAERYLATGAEFRKAWLTAQAGDDQQALHLFSAVPEAERNALYLFERGALLARAGRHQDACRELQAALTLEPELFPAFDALAGVLAHTGRFDQLEKLLKQTLSAGRFSGYCWTRLAELHAQRGEREPALAAGLKALDEGSTETGLLVLCAQLLESAQRFEEAEAMLLRLPGGGCGGGAHPLLAEYWLRRGENLNQALESFKGALRQERDNPRWLLRIAQVYLAKGWRKEAAEQIERLMRQDAMPEQIRAEVKAVADQL